ncbi:hypothetical protein [Phenylobacterium sp.]|uniref:hypothetical protein n=1 Tax=Phenylobacterium sp. TaxID=1871053 RepID=UPI0027340F19|nr:hypothetical protein [Phenylobacterium sp.]MDP3855032.1 hypothetical protein [Phenylobacterium sp.]
MRRMDTLAASAGLIACLALVRPDEPPSPALAADAWLIERELEIALTELSGSFEACYAATLPRSGETDGRARMVLAATCYGDAAILLA